MNVFFDYITNNIDKVFIWFLLVSTVSLLCVNLYDIFSGKEFKFILAIKRMKKSVESLSYLLISSESIKKEDFLNHIVNNGDDPEVLDSEIIIDNQYLTTTSVFMKKR